MALLGGLLAARFIDEGFGFLPEGAIEQLRRDLGVGYTTITAVFAAPYLGSLPALAFTARSDRTGRRALALSGTVVSAASLGGFAMATTAPVAVVAAVLWGFGASLMVHGAELELAAVPDDAPDGELHRRLRWSNLLGTVGDVAGPLLLAGVLVLGWSWRVAFWVAAAVTLAYAAWLSRYPFAAADPQAGVDESPAWRDPVAWRLGAYAFFLMPFDETWLAFLIAWLQVDEGLSASTAALAGMVAVLGATLGFVPVAAATARRSDRGVLVTAGLVLAVAGAAVAGLPAWAAVLAGLVVNAGISVAWVTLQHAALTLRPGSEGQVMSVVAAIEHTTIVLPLALGLLADRWGLAVAFLAYLAIGGALIVVAATGRRSDRSPVPLAQAAPPGSDRSGADPQPGTTLRP